LTHSQQEVVFYSIKSTTLLSKSIENNGETLLAFTFINPTPLKKITEKTYVVHVYN
jgi:hypothetical protein